jgi:hypothetical protein
MILDMVALQGKAVDVALPVSYLYLLHSHQPACLQAHVLFCSILRHAAVVRPCRNHNEMYAVQQTLDNLANRSNFNCDSEIAWMRLSSVFICSITM